MQTTLVSISDKNIDKHVVNSLSTALGKVTVINSAMNILKLKVGSQDSPIKLRLKKDSIIKKLIVSYHGNDEHPAISVEVKGGVIDGDIQFVNCVGKVQLLQPVILGGKIIGGSL